MAVAFADVSAGHSGSMSLNGSGQLVFGMSSKPVISGATTADRLASTEAALAALGLTTSS
jgi:hypothetical protein